jgi:hypothetical protein
MTFYSYYYRRTFLWGTVWNFFPQIFERENPPGQRELWNVFSCVPAERSDVCVCHMLYIARCWDICVAIFIAGVNQNMWMIIYNLSLCPKAETCDGAPVPLYCTCWRVKNKSTYSHSIIRYRTRPKFPVRLLLMCPAAAAAALLLLNLKPYSFIRFELHAPRSKAW